jgi:hypothetical protein
MARWLAVWAGIALANVNLPQKVPEKDDEYFELDFRIWRVFSSFAGTVWREKSVRVGLRNSLLRSIRGNGIRVPSLPFLVPFVFYK